METFPTKSPERTEGSGHAYWEEARDLLITTFLVSTSMFHFPASECIQAFTLYKGKLFKVARIPFRMAGIPPAALPLVSGPLVSQSRSTVP
jgi:hypothetical protein